MQLIEDIGNSLKELDSKVSTAESCTSGYISNLLTSKKGSSDYFEGSLVVYSNEAKINVLGIEKELIDEHTEVSDQVVRRMAEKVKELMGTDYSIATTGYADASGYGTEENPAGTIYIAVSSPEGTISKKILLKDSRGRNIYLATIEVIVMLKAVIKNRQTLVL
jgi:nicotinamide-nucleotide amidase